MAAGGFAKQAPFHSDQLFQHRGAAHAVQRLQFLFNAAIGQRRDQFLFILCMDSNYKTIGSAHLDAVRVYCPAVEVFGLPFYHGHPAGEGKFRHLQLLCKRQLLLGLAKPGPILALIKHSAAQIAFQCKPPGCSCFCSTTGFANHLTSLNTGGR